MSWKAQAHVLEMIEGITRIEKYVLQLLAYYHNDETARCDPSITRLGRVLLMSTRHIQRTLRSLHKKGLIIIIERAGRSSQYDLTFLLTPDTDVRGDRVSPLTQLCHPTPDTDVTLTERNITSSEDSSEEESSSSAEEEEDFQNRVASFYSSRLPASPHFVSAVPAPGPYFRTLRENGDSLPACDLEACWELAEAIHTAVNVGYPDHKIVTFPGPAALPGLAACLEPVRRYALRPQFLRLALYVFCGGDGVDPPELRGSDVLKRIAQRPDLFAEALHQQSESFG